MVGAVGKYRRAGFMEGPQPTRPRFANRNRPFGFDTASAVLGGVGSAWSGRPPCLVRGLALKGLA